MVFFAHMILMDSETETALCLGRTSVVGVAGPEPVNLPNLDLAIR
jgi:Xaa-Pro dipeptidase